MPSFLERISQQQFSTIVSLVQDDIFSLENHRILKKILSSRNFLSLSPIVIVADPFLFVHKNELYLFYENQMQLTGNGVIMMTKTSDLKNWSKPIVVLKEDFHLSYPYVFEVDGQIYMMPETGNDRGVKLYSTNEYLTQWTYHKTILKGRRFVDSSIICHNKKFYLFTTDYTDEINILRLFYSDYVDDQWHEHPSSPIAKGKDIGRCAGALFSYNRKLYRPCQLTCKRYGEGVDIYEVLKLSPTVYEEKRIKKIIPNSGSKYKMGGHHFSFCYFKDQTIVATDVFELRFNIFEIINRVGLKLKLFRQK